MKMRKIIALLLALCMLLSLSISAFAADDVVASGTIPDSKIKWALDSNGIKVTKVDVQPGTFEIGNYDDFSAGKNSIALNINGCVTKGAGSLTLADGAFPPINAEKSLAIRYKAKVSTNETMTNALAATVIFTIAAVAEGG